MSKRTIAIAPPPRPSVSSSPDAPTESKSRKPPRRPAAKKPPPTTRRRVHVTVNREVAAALRDRSQDSSNTAVLIESLDTEIDPPAATAGPFAPRRTVSTREGVYFYLASSEIDHIDRMVRSIGYQTRSALIDAALRRHLLT